MVKIKRLDGRELSNTLPLIWETFLNCEAVNYPEQGKQAFRKAVYDENYLSSLLAYGAYDDGEIVGVIATRKGGSHIALFFVKQERQSQGIGRKLWNAVLEENICQAITVHSSLFAVEIYKRLGFIQTDAQREEDGIIYVPMEYRTVTADNCPCKRKGCIRYRRCNECRAHHADSTRPRPCEK